MGVSSNSSASLPGEAHFEVSKGAVRQSSLRCRNPVAKRWKRRWARADSQILATKDVLEQVDALACGLRHVQDSFPPSFPRSADGGSTVAYLTFADEAAAQKALLLSGSSLQGESITVSAAEEGYSPSPDAIFYPTPTSAPKPEAAVKVSNLSPGTTVKDLQDFFAFAGSICSIHLQAGEDGGPGEAHVSFYSTKALDNALLLSDAKVKGNIVTVTAAPDYEPPTDSSFIPRENSTGLSPANQAQAMVQKLLEQGYTLGAAAAQKAKDFDEKHQFTRTASAKAGEFRESAAAAVTDLQKKFAESSEVLSRTFKKRTQEVDERVKAVDEQYKVTEKTRGLFSMAEQRVNDLGEMLLKSKVLAQGREFIMTTAAKVSGAVEGKPGAGPSTGGAGEEGAAAGAPANSAAEDPLATASRDEVPATTPPPPPPPAEAAAPPSVATEEKPEAPAKQPATGDAPVF